MDAKVLGLIGLILLLKGKGQAAPAAPWTAPGEPSGQPPSSGGGGGSPAPSSTTTTDYRNVVKAIQSNLNHARLVVQPDAIEDAWEHLVVDGYIGGKTTAAANGFDTALALANRDILLGNESLSQYASVNAENLGFLWAYDDALGDAIGNYPAWGPLDLNFPPLGTSGMGWMNWYG